jgi:2-dehydropantoate 2-reductase
VSKSKVFILGGGAIGLTLAAYLLRDGQEVELLRTSSDEMPQQIVDISIEIAQDQTITAPVKMVSLSQLEKLDGIAVVTAKAYANQKIATILKTKGFDPIIVVMQNGINVEKPFLEAGFSSVYRCVLYATAQKISEFVCSYRKVASSPIGLIQGDVGRLEQTVATLNTDGFEFHLEPKIQNDIWKKAIINAVFNSVCPLLEVDNGIFWRDQAIANLAREIVQECLQVSTRLGLKLSEETVMAQLFTISQRSNGQLISTLQDINNKRRTEIESLNLEIGQIAQHLVPPVSVTKTKLLGEMVLYKSNLDLLEQRT